jgi:GntR family transcriptional regulator, arabinose operon transcriptional repressor
MINYYKGMLMADNKGYNKGLLPPYYLIRRHVLDWLENGVLMPGDLLPTEVSLAKRFDVSRMTIRKALQQLEDDGYIIARQGAGRRVVERPVRKRQGIIRIGAIFHAEASDAYGDIQGLREVASEYGVDLNLYFYNEYVGKNSINDLMANLTDGGVDGLLICCRNINNDLILHYSRFLPLVVAYRDCSDSGIPSFFFNWHWSGFELTELLLKRDCQRLIVLLKRDEYFFNVNRQLLDGINYSLYRDNAEDIDMKILYLPSDNEPDHLQQLDPVYEQLEKEGKIGIISYWHWVLVELAKSKYAGKIPEEICLAALVGADILQEQSPLPVTAYEKDYKGMIRAASKRLIAIIQREDLDNNAKAHPFYGKIVDRGSC